MALFADEGQLTAWRDNIRSYSEAKKTGTLTAHVESPKRITHKEVKLREAEFDPILQHYNNQDRVS